MTRTARTTRTAAFPGFKYSPRPPLIRAAAALARRRRRLHVNECASESPVAVAARAAAAAAAALEQRRIVGYGFEGFVSPPHH
jgi:hypothetical protein